MSKRRRKPSQPVFEEDPALDLNSAAPPVESVPEETKKTPVFHIVEDEAQEAEASVAEELPMERDFLPPEIKNSLLNDQLDEVHQKVVFQDKVSPIDDLLDDIIEQGASEEQGVVSEDNLLDQILDDSLNGNPVDHKVDLDIFKNKSEDSAWESTEEPEPILDAVKNPPEIPGPPVVESTEFVSEPLATDETPIESDSLEDNSDFWSKIAKSQTDDDFSLPGDQDIPDLNIDEELEQEVDETILDQPTPDQDIDVIEKPVISITESESKEGPEEKTRSGWRGKFAEIKSNIADSVGEDPEEVEEAEEVKSELIPRQPESEEELIDAIKTILDAGLSEEDMASELIRIGVDPAEIGLSGPSIGPREDLSESGAAAPTGPPPHVAVRRARLAGHNALPLELPLVKDEVDEIQHSLSAFAELQHGQVGVVRMSIRSNPEFQNVASQWIKHRKAGINPDDDKGAVAKFIDWIKYCGAYCWYSINQQQNKGLPPPQSPGKRGKDLTPLAPSKVSDEEKETWKAAQAKARENNHFEVALRTMAIGARDDAEALEQIATEAASGFDSFNSNFQEIVWTQDHPYDSVRGLMGARKPKSANEIPMVLSSAELSEVAHPPDDLTKPHGVRVERSHFKQIPIANALTVDDPYEPHDGLIPIGIANPGSEDQEYLALNNSQLDQHMLIVGRTGSGKSEWLKWACFGVAKADYPFVIIDPHGALSDDILRTLIATVPERADDIVYCDLSDGNWPVALNPLDISSPEQVDPTVGSIMEMLSSQMNLGISGAPRAVMFARQALTALCYANIVLKDPSTKCTLLDVVRFFNNPDFRHLIVSFCGNNSVKETFDYDNGMFENLSEKQQTEMSMPIVRAFSRLAESNAFAAVFSSPENKLDFGSLVGSKKLLIVRLARHSSQRMLGQFVGSLILPWLLGSMDDWGRQKNPETGEFTGTGVRVFVDEAPTLFGPDSSVPELLAEARKWDLGLVMAAQFLDQFDPGLIKAALANTASKIALAIELNTAQIITKSLAGGNSSIVPGDLADLPNYHYYGNILMPNPGGGVGGSGAFSAKCLPPIKDELTDEGRAMKEEIIDRSRKLVANSIDYIDENESNRVNNIMLNLRELYYEQAESTYDAPSALFPDDEDDDPSTGFDWS